MELRLYWEILRRRWKVLPFFLLIPIATLAVMLAMPTVYKSKAKLWVKISAREQKYIKGLPTDIGKYEYSDQNNAMGTIEELIESRPVIEGAIRKLDLRDKKNDLLPSSKFLDPNKLALVMVQHRGIEIQHLKDSEVFELVGYSTDPEEAVAIVNSVVDEFYAGFFDYYRKETVEAQRVIEDSLVEVKARLEEAEVKYTDFRKQNRIYSETSQVTSQLNAIFEMEKELNSVEISIAEADKIVAALRSSPLSTLDDFADLDVSIDTSNIIDSYKNQLVTIETSIAKLLYDVTEEHPDVVALRMQEDSVKKLIQDEVSKQYSSLMVGKSNYYDTIAGKYAESIVDRITLKARKDVLKRQMASKQKELDLIPGVEKDLDYLSTDLTNIRDIYTNLSSSLEMVKVAQKLNLSNIFTFQPAALSGNMKDSIYFPKKRTGLIISTILAFMLGITTVFLIEYVDDRVVSSGQLRQRFDLRHVAEVPFEKGLAWNGSASSRTAFANSIHDLSALIGMIGAGTGGARSIAVLSPGRAEGRSTIAAFLADSLAEKGRSVLLIEADMRCPSIGDLIGARGDGAGLAPYLMQDGASLRLLQNNHARFDYLPAGNLETSAPQALLESARFGAMVSELSGKYDSIVFDTPSMSAGADARLVAKHAQCVVLVTAQGCSSNSAVEGAIRDLQLSGGMEPLIVVLNKAG